MKNKPLNVRMGFAINGLLEAYRGEKSFRFQVVVTILTMAFLGLVQPPLIWWAIIIIMVGLVLFAELTNTAIEILCDYVQPEHSESIRKIKDISAGAVFVLSLCSVLVGLFFLLELLGG